MTEALTAEQLAQLRTELLAMSESLQGQLAESDESAKPVKLDQQSVGRVSRIDAIQQQQMAKAGQQQMQVQLQGIRNALTAVDEGDYGYCRSCDEPIGYPRLKARPEAPLCLQCQEKMERQ